MDLEFIYAASSGVARPRDHFVWVPEDHAALIQDLASAIADGWG